MSGLVVLASKYECEQIQPSSLVEHLAIMVKSLTNGMSHHQPGGSRNRVYAFPNEIRGSGQI